METSSETIKIRRARPEDADVLARMYSADMHDLGIDRSPEQLADLVNHTLEHQGVHTHTFVATAPEHGIVGVLLADPFWSLKVAGRALWIEELYVAPTHRRHGIGRMLVDHLLDWADEEGFRGVELEAYRMNTGASLLYRALGFQRLARERYCYYFE